MTFKRFSLVVLIIGMLGFAFNACEEKNPTYYPSSDDGGSDVLNPSDPSDTTNDPSDTTDDPSDTTDNPSDTTDDPSDTSDQGPDPFKLDVRVFNGENNNQWMRGVEVHLSQTEEGPSYVQKQTTEENNENCPTDAWRANFEIDAENPGPGTYYIWTFWTQKDDQGNQQTYASDTLMLEINESKTDENKVRCADLTGEKQE